MFRRPLLALTIFGLIAALGGCAQTPPTPDTTADQAKLKSDALIWFEHYANADGEGMANLYAEDALLMPPGAPAVTGRPGIKAFLGDGFIPISAKPSLMLIITVASCKRGVTPNHTMDCPLILKPIFCKPCSARSR